MAKKQNKPEEIRETVEEEVKDSGKYRVTSDDGTPINKAVYTKEQAEICAKKHPYRKIEKI